MTLLWSGGRRGWREAILVLLAALPAAALGPALRTWLGPAGPSLGLALAATLGGWAVRGRLPGPALRLILAGAAGAAAGLLAQGPAPVGLAHLVLGLGVGLALAPERRGAALLGAMPAAAGALIGGSLAGALARAAWVLDLAPVPQQVLLGGSVALGIALGHAGRWLLLVPGQAPGWVRDLLGEAEPGARAVLAAAMDAYARVMQGLGGPRDALASWEQEERLGQAERHLLACAEAVRDHAQATQAMAGLEDDQALAGHAELLEARRRLRQGLTARRTSAMERAGREAAALASLALDGGAELPPTGEERAATLPVPAGLEGLA